MAGAGDDSADAGAAVYRSLAPAPPQYRSAAAAPQRALPRSLAPPLPPALIVDGANVNKYYFCQVLQKKGGSFAAYFKWGKIGEAEYGDRRMAKMPLSKRGPQLAPMASSEAAPCFPAAPRARQEP